MTIMTHAGQIQDYDSATRQQCAVYEWCTSDHADPEEPSWWHVADYNEIYLSTEPGLPIGDHTLPPYYRVCIWQDEGETTPRIGLHTMEAQLRRMTSAEALQMAADLVDAVNRVDGTVTDSDIR